VQTCCFVGGGGATGQGEMRVQACDIPCAQGARDMPPASACIGQQYDVDDIIQRKNTWRETFYFSIF